MNSEVNQSLRDVGFGSGGLQYRRLDASEGSVAITVVVHRPVAGDYLGTRTDRAGARAMITSVGVLNGFTVGVLVTTASGGPTPVAAVDELLSDRRLLVAA